MRGKRRGIQTSAALAILLSMAGLARAANAPNPDVGNPFVFPVQAVAWEVFNIDIDHLDGPFALPGMPNPHGYMALDPLRAFWSAPDDCPYEHLHAPFIDAGGTIHDDPAPGPPLTASHCGHGGIIYLDANGDIVGGSSPTATPPATPTPSPTGTPTPTGLPSSTLTATVIETATSTASPGRTITPTPPSPSTTPILGASKTPTSPPPPPTPTIQLDFGDAADGLGDPNIPPPNYPTYLENNGARHAIVEGYYLGGLIDREDDGLPNVTATGDDAAGVDDEDGVALPAALVVGHTATIEVVASALGRLDAWVDFNRDGDWQDDNEKIADSIELEPGTNVVEITTPGEAAVGLTFARFRYSSAGGLSYDGAAADGEVEDYRIALTVPGDADGDGDVDADDVTAVALAIFSDPPFPGADANGDGLVNAADIVAITNML